jgi:hypothetical protein
MARNPPTRVSFRAVERLVFGSLERPTVMRWGMMRSAA